jgi:adenosylmethionine-8-amino-7-oxononanoate aminotransferase
MALVDGQLASTVKPEGMWENVFSYHPFDVSLERAEGIYLYDQEGNRYIDVSGGPMAVNLPHGDPRMIEAITEQVKRYAYCHPALADPQRAELASALAEVTPGDLNEFFFVCGGSEAVETAIKLARQYQVASGKKTAHKMIGVQEAYHGMTLGTMSLSGSPGYNVFESMMPTWPHIEQYSDFRKPEGMDREEWGKKSAEALERRIHWEGPDTVAAFFATPWGCGSEYGLMPPKSYWKEIRRICDAYDVLLVADEVVSGFGRSGRWFGMEHFDVTPDLMTLAKGMSGSNAPLGALAVSEKVGRPFREGAAGFIHGFTNGGHPLSLAAGLAALRIIKEDGLVENSLKVGEHLHSYRDKLLAHPSVADVRGTGLFLVMELVEPDNEGGREYFSSDRQAEILFRQIGFKNGLVLYSALYGRRASPLFRRGLPMWISPPLSITRDQVDDVFQAMDTTLTEWEAALGVA